ncbi:MAG: hydroxyacid dehydrogenase [candidate division NC10 bacterium]|nr:hydroxyacid dehydrogenase [candidate division NC10 bacterium]
MKRIAVLDDYQGAALSAASWERLSGRATVDVYRDTLMNEGDLVERLSAYEILVPIRERTRFPASLLRRLPALALLALTGRNLGQVDAKAATERGILLTDTEGSGASPVELTIGLMLAVVRRIPQEAAALRSGAVGAVADQPGRRTAGQDAWDPRPRAHRESHRRLRAVPGDAGACVGADAG